MSNKGITLIALIITIIIMIIIAGVSITITTRNNSVIKKAEEATYKNSISQIEQKLNEVYVNNYIDIEAYNSNLKQGTPVTKARALAYYLEDQLGNNNIFRKVTDNKNGVLLSNHGFYSSTSEAKDGDEFAYVSDEGKILYFLSPKMLKKYESTLEVLDLQEPYSRQSTNDIDYLYGVTGDLRVFVIMTDLDYIIGVDKEELSYYDFNSVIYKGGSDWTKIFNTQEDVTYQDGQAKKSITINFNSTDVDANFNFSGIGELKHLSSLTLKNPKQADISGIADSAETLTYLWIENPSISNYSGLDKLTNLQRLYLYNVSQEQLNLIIDKMKNTNYKKLEYFGVIGTGGWSDYSQGFTDERYYGSKNGSITDISCFKKLSSETQSKIKYLFLTANKITDLSPLENFSSLVSIRADSNNITSLNGLGNKKNLTTIRICNNNLTSLNDISGVPKLTWLDVRKNVKLNNISNAKNINSLKKLWFVSDASLKRNDSDDQIAISEIDDEENKKFLQNLGAGLQIDPKYAIRLADYADTEELQLTSNIDIDENYFRNLVNFEKLDKLSIDNITIKSSTTGKALSSKATNDLINEVLSDPNFSNLRFLQIINMNDKLTDAKFLSSLNSLVELDFRNNSATDLKGLSKTPIVKLSINNANIDLTSDEMQKVISQLTYGRTDGGNRFWTKGSGLVLCNNSLYSQLGKCTKITKLHLDRDWKEPIATTNDGGVVDLSNCTNLTDFMSYYIYSKYTLPKSVKNVQFGQSNSKGSLDLSKCENLEYLNIIDNVNKNILEALIKTIPSNNSLTRLRIYGQSATESSTNYSYFSSANLKNVATLEITGWANRTIPFNSTECLSNMTGLENVTITYAPNLTTLADMSKLNSLKKLTINNTGLEEIPDNGLSKLPNLEQLNFSTNCLTNLYGLVPKDSGDFKRLTHLYLQNNALEDQFSMGGVLTYNIPSKIFKELYNRALRYLYLSGNKFSNLSDIKSLQWAGKNGF